jgi:uncharacterized protein (UPF0261 family)
MTDKTILVIGTYDTKDDELTFLADVIHAEGGQVITMDVSVLGAPSRHTGLFQTRCCAGSWEFHRSRHRFGQ